MKSAIGFSITAGLLTLTWCVWNESATLGTVATGLGFSLVSLVLTNRFLLKARYHQVFALSPLTALRYVAVLIVEIFRSGVHAIHITLTGRINVGVVNIPTGITNPLHGVLVANAITLTPGTVTIDHSHGNYKVIWIECTTTDPNEAADRIKASFERVFARPLVAIELHAGGVNGAALTTPELPQKQGLSRDVNEYGDLFAHAAATATATVSSTTAATTAPGSLA